MGAWVAFELAQVHCCLCLPLYAQNSSWGLFNKHKYQVFVMVGSWHSSLQIGVITVRVQWY